MQAVEVCPPTQSNRIPIGLELQPAKDEEFSVVRLRSALERVYMSIGVGSLRALYEVQRIRNWEDGGQRTAIALAVSHALVLKSSLAHHVVTCLSHTPGIRLRMALQHLTGHLLGFRLHFDSLSFL